MVKNEKRKSSPSSSSVGRHFFKVYLPSESSHRLIIPTAFVDSLNGSLGQEVILRSSLSKPCPVRLKKLQHQYHFQNGWDRFVKAHSLALGEFLVFRYDGSSTFTVTVYGHSGVEREATSSRNSITETRAAPDPKRKILCTGSDKANPRCTVYVNRISPYKNLPKHVLEENNIKVPPNIILRDSNNNTWPAKVFSKNGRYMITGGWQSFCRDKNLKPNDECDFEFLRGEGGECNVIHVHTPR